MRPPERSLGAHHAQSGALRRLPPLGSESGDTLIEVVISAALISLVVIAVLFGLDSTNRATANSRARSQADGLAQQDEERLRSEPIKKLTELERKENVTVGATTYTITTTAKYIADETSTASCTSSVADRRLPEDDLDRHMAVDGPQRSRNGDGSHKPACRLGLDRAGRRCRNPAGGRQSRRQRSRAIEQRPRTRNLLNGCAILALPPGEYTINVSKTGYVDPNGYANTESDKSVTKTVYLPAETTSKEGYNLGPAGKLQVSFTEAGEPITSLEGDSFVYFNTGMAHYETFPESRHARNIQTRS